MVYQHNLRTCTALITWRDIDKVYQHSDTMLLYFLLMEILNITGTYITTYHPTEVGHVSLITNFREEILDPINNSWVFELHVVPLPDTLQS